MKRPLRNIERHVALLVGDAVAAMVATLLTLWTWSLTATETFSVEFLADRAQWFLAIPLWVLVLMPTRDIATAFDLRATCRAVIRVSALLLVVYLAVFFFVGGDRLPRLVVLYVLTYGSLFVLAWRVIAQRCLTHTKFSRRAFVVGTGRLVKAALRLLGDPGLKGWRLLGVVAPEGLHLISRRGPLAVPAFDRVEDLERWLPDRIYGCNWFYEGQFTLLARRNVSSFRAVASAERCSVCVA